MIIITFLCMGELENPTENNVTSDLRGVIERPPYSTVLLMFSNSWTVEICNWLKWLLLKKKNLNYYAYLMRYPEKRVLPKREEHTRA